jgi:two-component system catabolic regulation response regulator CreB
MKHRILIIEDEPAIADNIVYALETEGFHCRWCATGGEGLAALSASDSGGVVPGAAGSGVSMRVDPGAGASVAGGFDLVVLDVGLPDSQGFEVCREIRKHYNVPVIFLTARAAEIDRIVGLEIGADDYMVKPFSPRELAARIKAVLRRTVAAGSQGAPPRSQGAPTGPGPFHHDEERCRISYHGKALELSRNEYRLLCALLEKPGRVLSRERLMQKAWDSPESSLERTVDAHVKSLRAKLREVKADEDPIQTHRGLGYSLKEDW